MTNKDKAKEIVQDVIHDRGCSDVVTDRAIYNSAMTMAEWKDEQLKDKKQALIDKVCEWLEEHLYDDEYIFRDNEGTWVDSYSLNEGLKQAMKGGNNE